MKDFGAKAYVLIGMVAMGHSGALTYNQGLRLKQMGCPSDIGLGAKTTASFLAGALWPIYLGARVGAAQYGVPLSCEAK